MNDTDRHERIDEREESIDAWRATAHPAILEWLESGLKARQHYAARGYATDAALVPGMEALLRMARVLGQ